MVLNPIFATNRAEVVQHAIASCRACRACRQDGELVVYAITVTDEFGTALGDRATHTFRLKVLNQQIAEISFSEDDPPICAELLAWI